MRWEVFYSDKRTISSEEISPEKVDRRADVQVIIQESPDHKWVTLSGYDYYVWDTHGKETKWWGVDIFGKHHYDLRPGWKCTLFGTMIDKDTFREIFDLARSKFGEKKLFSKDERRE